MITVKRNPVVLLERMDIDSDSCSSSAGSVERGVIKDLEARVPKIETEDREGKQVATIPASEVSNNKNCRFVKQSNVFVKTETVHLSSRLVSGKTSRKSANKSSHSSSVYYDRSSIKLRDVYVTLVDLYPDKSSTKCNKQTKAQASKNLARVNQQLNCKNGNISDLDFRKNGYAMTKVVKQESCQFVKQGNHCLQNGVQKFLNPNSYNLENRGSISLNSFDRTADISSTRKISSEIPTGTIWNIEECSFANGTGTSSNTNKCTVDSGADNLNVIGAGSQPGISSHMKEYSLKNEPTAGWNVSEGCRESQAGTGLVTPCSSEHLARISSDLNESTFKCPGEISSKMSRFSSRTEAIKSPNFNEGGLANRGGSSSNKLSVANGAQSSLNKSDCSLKNGVRTAEIMNEYSSGNQAGTVSAVNEGCFETEARASGHVNHSLENGVSWDTNHGSWENQTGTYWNMYNQGLDDETRMDWNVNQCSSEDGAEVKNESFENEGGSLERFSSSGFSGEYSNESRSISSVVLKDLSLYPQHSNENRASLEHVSSSGYSDEYSNEARSVSSAVFKDWSSYPQHVSTVRTSTEQVSNPGYAGDFSNESVNSVVLKDPSVYPQYSNVAGTNLDQELSGEYTSQYGDELRPVNSATSGMPPLHSKPVNSVECNSASGTETQLACALCPKQFPLRAELITHLREHFGEKPYSCHSCSEAFSETGALTSHLKKHSNKKFVVCGLCSEILKSETSLVKHSEQIHGDKKPFACTSCSATYRRRHNLEHHLRTRCISRPFYCTVCPMSYLRVTDLKRHVADVHSEEKSYPCFFCPKTFRFDGDLEGHMKKTHSNRTLFNCEMCPAMFTNAALFHQHVKTHSVEEGSKPQTLGAPERHVEKRADEETRFEDASQTQPLDVTQDRSEIQFETDFTMGESSLQNPTEVSEIMNECSLDNLADNSSRQQFSLMDLAGVILDVNECILES